MTELKTFLVALYDALSEAETEAFVHGRERYLELAEREEVPRDISVPVYHAADLNVSLDVGIVAEETESGTEIRITESSEDDSTLSFNAEVFDLIEEGDIQTIDYDDLVSEYPGQFPAVSDIDESNDGTIENIPESVEGDEEQQREKKEGEKQQDEERQEKDREEQQEKEHEEEKQQEEDQEEEKQREKEEEKRKKEEQEEPERRSVRRVEGIDRSGVDVLERSGVETVADIMGRTPEELREMVGEEEPVSPERADSWIRAAATEAASGTEETLEQSVESIDGIGPAYGERLADAGIETLLDLIQEQPEEVAAAVSTDTHAVSPERAEQWIEQVRRQFRTTEGSADKTPDHDTEQ